MNNEEIIDGWFDRKLLPSEEIQTLKAAFNEARASERNAIRNKLESQKLPVVEYRSSSEIYMKGVQDGLRAVIEIIKQRSDDIV